MPEAGDDDGALPPTEAVSSLGCPTVGMRSERPGPGRLYLANAGTVAELPPHQRESVGRGFIVRLP